MVARGKPGGPFRTQPIPGDAAAGGRAGRVGTRPERGGRTRPISRRNKLRQAETANPGYTAR